jgi:hypothetical protein
MGVEVGGALAAASIARDGEDSGSWRGAAGAAASGSVRV